MLHRPERKSGGETRRGLESRDERERERERERESVERVQFSIGPCGRKKKGQWRGAEEEEKGSGVANRRGKRKNSKRKS
jgi:hypothetical protein